jgi:hypothetical protein
MLGCRLAFFTRYDKDGGIRPLRMNVTDFAKRHLGKNE